MSGDELDVEAECAREGTECGGGGVGLAALDAADVGLVDAGALGELLLREVLRAALAGELSREREVQAERFELGDDVGALGASLGLDLVDEVVEGAEAVRRRLSASAVVDGEEPPAG